jgi:microcystin-dependent protein
VLQLTETDATNNNQRWDINAENEVMAIRAVNDAYTNAGNAIEIQRTGTTIDSVSMPNGNVNIGTNSSTSKLTVVDNSANDAVRITQTGSGNALVVEDSANPDATPFVVRADGTVGIGASSANAKLQFDNAVATNGYDANKIRLYDDGTTVYGLGIAPAQLGYRAEQHVFYSDATTPAERLRIGSSGNVGINTTTPTERLDVNGTVKATAFSGPLTGNVTGNVTGTASAIADGSVSTAKIVDANVTDAKLAATLNLSSKTVTLPATIALPAGAVMAFAMNSAPAGWLAADGSNVNRTTYAALFSAISTTYGAGDGSTTFALPDLRGIFVRGSGSQTISGITYNKTFAAKEGDAFQGHEHTAPNGESLAYSSSGRAAGAANTWYGDTGTGDNIIGTDGTNGTPRTASETRPANIALLYCIKF